MRVWPVKGGTLGGEGTAVKLPQEEFEGRECELSTPLSSSLFLLKCDRGENSECSGRRVTA